MNERKKYELAIFLDLGNDFHLCGGDCLKRGKHKYYNSSDRAAFSFIPTVCIDETLQYIPPPKF